MDVALALDKDKGIAEGQGITALLEEKPVVAELARRPVTYKLDLIAAYLLRVHFFSYYGGDEAESEGDLLFTNVSQIACFEARAVIIAFLRHDGVGGVCLFLSAAEPVPAAGTLQGPCYT